MRTSVRHTEGKSTRGRGIERQAAVQMSYTSDDDSVWSVEDRRKHKWQGLLELPDVEPD